MAEVKFKAPDEKFDVAFSYASEDHEWVKQLGDALRDWGVTVFDYRTPEGDAKLLGKNLFDELAKVFRRAPFCVVFVSHDYDKKFWTQDEFASIQKTARKKRDYLIPIFLDHDVKLKGLRAGKREELTGRDVDALKARAAPIAHLVDKYKEKRRLLWSCVATAALHIVVALIVALVYLNRPSNTSIVMKDATQDGIRVEISNGGAKPSEVSGFRLKFADDLPIEVTRLKIAGTDSTERTIQGNRNVVLLLTAADLPIRQNPATSEAYRYREIEGRLSGSKAKLEIDVHESNDSPGETHPMSTRSFLLGQIDSFLKRKMAELTLTKIDPGAEGITVHVVNGARRVQLVGFKLIAAPIDDTDLPIRGEPELSAHQGLTLLLDPEYLESKCDPKTQSRPAYHNMNWSGVDEAILETAYREVDDRSGKIHRSSQTLPARNLSGFLQPRMSSLESPCEAL